jgi:hypothetical protein
VEHRVDTSGIVSGVFLGYALGEIATEYNIRIVLAQDAVDMALEQFGFKAVGTTMPIVKEEYPYDG